MLYEVFLKIFHTVAVENKNDNDKTNNRKLWKESHENKVMPLYRLLALNPRSYFTEVFALYKC